MADSIDLEIELSRQDAFSYAVDLRFSDPDDPAGPAPERGQVRFDLGRLRANWDDPQAYGQELTGSLFGDPRVKDYFEKAWVLAQPEEKNLRLRLFIHRTAVDLNELRWETLRNPLDGSWLLPDERLLFSRFLRSSTWERVQRRVKGLLKALVVVANPSDLQEGKWKPNGRTLDPVNVPEELARARQGLGRISAQELGGEPGPAKRATLDNLLDGLRQNCDILYLVCHGALLSVDGTGAFPFLGPEQGETVAGEPAPGELMEQVKRQPGPFLWLEKEDGSAAVTPGRELVERIKGLPPNLRPRLVVLASCQSAGSGQQGGEAVTADPQGALSALGPSLAQIGVPAVIAMLGSISMQTVAEFMPVFFRELIVDGQIDRAMAAARSVVRDRPDGWMPVLYLRFSDGKIWYTPGFGGEKDQEFKKMASLTRAIKDRTCTALIGQGLVETLIGSRRDIALRWADDHKYPLSPYDREDLPRVAQYILTELDPDYLTGALRDALRLTITEYYPERVGRELLESESWDPAQLQQAMELVSEAHWTPENPGPYQYLAQLRLPIYINTNYGDLLASALRKAGADPVTCLAPWNDAIPAERWQYDGDPTPEQPLIYHLFGHYDEPASLVLAEDDYFDYLINMTRYSDKVPKRVRSALSSTALIFLGFRLDDWAFRVLFRLIWGQAGSSMLQRKSHAAVQIEPDEGRIVDAGRARSYLMDYFQKGHVTLYWGGAEDFLRELIASL